MEKLELRYPVIVEGKYDKIKLSQVVDGVIIVLDGFSVFNSDSKKALIKTLCADGAILLTDSDKAGTFIRRKLKGYFNETEIYNVYIPQIQGREKRKKKDSADGLLGVEGMDVRALYELLLPFAGKNSETKKRKEYTKSDMYEKGLSGGKNSAALRDGLAARLGLPKGLSANALLEAINTLGAEM